MTHHPDQNLWIVSLKAGEYADRQVWPLSAWTGESEARTELTDRSVMAHRVNKAQVNPTWWERPEANLVAIARLLGGEAYAAYVRSDGDLLAEHQYTLARVTLDPRRPPVKLDRLLENPNAH